MGGEGERRRKGTPRHPLWTLRCGKSPLSKALVKHHPELSKRIQKVLLFNSRPPRPGKSTAWIITFAHGSRSRP